jgi:hypothetical protein
LLVQRKIGKESTLMLGCAIASLLQPALAPLRLTGKFMRLIFGPGDSALPLGLGTGSLRIALG